jgi:hypothetical protein
LGKFRRRYRGIANFTPLLGTWPLMTKARASLWWMVHLPSQSSATAASHLGRACPSRRSREALAARPRPCRRESRYCPSFSPGRCACRSPRAWRGPRTACASRDPSSRQGPHAQAKQNSSKLPDMFESAFKLQRPRRNNSGCSKSVRGVAFLCGISTPSLIGSATPPLLFQRSGQFRNVIVDDVAVLMREG